MINCEPPKAADQIKRLKILIVEDDESSLMFLSIILRKNNDLLVAKNGEEAVATCRAHPELDLVLMDIRMPLLNGYDATQQIRVFNGDVIIIAQTANGFASDREVAIKAGCNDYITKPIDKEQLRNLISKYFNN